MPTRSVLFLCVGNTGRSQMAEAFLRKHGGDRFDVHSAGLAPGETIDPLVGRVMDEVGLNLTGQFPKSLRTYLGHARFDAAIFVCARTEANCPLSWPSAFVSLSWPFENPAAATGTSEERLAKYRSIRDAIERKICSWLAEAK